VCWCGPVGIGLGITAYVLGRAAQRTARSDVGVARAGAALGLVGAGLTLLWMVSGGFLSGGDG